MSFKVPSIPTILWSYKCEHLPNGSSFRRFLWFGRVKGALYFSCNWQPDISYLTVGLVKVNNQIAWQGHAEAMPSNRWIQEKRCRTESMCIFWGNSSCRDCAGVVGKNKWLKVLPTCLFQIIINAGKDMLLPKSISQAFDDGYHCMADSGNVCGVHWSWLIFPS